MLIFTIGAVLGSLVLVVSVFTISRGYLVGQRERWAERHAAAQADYVRDRIVRADSSGQESIADVLDRHAAGVVLLLYRHGDWMSSEAGVGPGVLPARLLDPVANTAGTATVSLRGEPFIAVAVPLQTGVTLFELSPLEELRSTLQILRLVLIACGLGATIGVVGLGLYASRRLMTPLHELADTAARIAGGQLDTRLPDTQDRDLVSIVASFNSMVESLQQRIERERRFFGDVSHELRTPLTALVTSVEVLRRHRAELTDRPGRALELVSSEVDHLRRLLEDLLTLARAEAGLHQDQPANISVAELLSHTLADSGRGASLLTVETDATTIGRKLALERAFRNLMDNADRHGGGLSGVTVRRTGRRCEVLVDDAGPGVAVAEREHIFHRFATAQAARGRHTAGTGLGLALVAESIAAHGGNVQCTDRPGGGARFVVTLPADDPEAIIVDSRP
jgi:signal transduction histidine kinase